MRPLRILVWHLHGSYLYYLTACSRHRFYVPFRPDRSGDYIGRWGHFPWGDNVHDVPAEEVKNLDLDCIIYQKPAHFFKERFEILSEDQKDLPRIYIEHDPPQEHPTNTAHPVDDPDTLLVHVTPFNRLMWDSRRTPATVIDHGVIVPHGISFTGETGKGIVVVNHIKRRGRRLGFDVYERVRLEVPLDHIGMGSLDVAGGLGEVLHHRMPEFISRYRFFFNPIRYTSMGLAVCEAMMLGMPVVGLATTEMASAVRNGVSGYVDTDIDRLIPAMKSLLKDPAEARRLGEGARRYACERFNIRRFTRDWDKALSLVTGTPLETAAPAANRQGGNYEEENCARQ